MRKLSLLTFVVLLMAFIVVSHAQTNASPSAAPAAIDADELADMTPPLFDTSNPSGKVMLSTILLVFGALLKKSPLKDWAIPFIIVAAGALLEGLLDGFTRVVIVRGIYCGCGAVAGHQLIKQFVSDRKDVAQQSVSTS